MARGRMLNNSISTSLKFDLLPDDTCRLLATWIISHLDFRGVFYGDPAIVQSLIFTRRRDVTIEQVNEYLQAMEGVGLIILFEAEGQQWQQWPGFSANQVGLRAEREKTDRPPPPGYTPPSAAENPQDGGENPQDGGNLSQDGGEKSAEEEGEIKIQLKVQLEDSAPSAGADAPKPSPTPTPSKKQSSKPKIPPLTPGAQEFLRLFSAKRFANAAQRNAVLALESEFPGHFVAAATWAAERGMSRGQAIAAIRSALPNWGKAKSKPRTDTTKMTGPDKWLAARQAAGMG